MKKLLLVVISSLFSLCLFMSNVEARFGGGHSSRSSSSSSRSSHSSWHSSGSSSYSSNSSSSNIDGTGLFTLFIIFLIVIIILYISTNQRGNINTVTIQKPKIRLNDNKIAEFKTLDANFSRIIFLDFVHLLYVKYYSHYGKKEFNNLKPFLNNAVQQDKMLDVLIGNQVIIINEIVINGIGLLAINQTANEDRIGVVIESNFTIHPAFHTQETGKQHSRYFRKEHWFLHREKGLLSLEPEKMQALTCPQCGSPAHFTDAGECPSCRTFIQKGQYQWYVKEKYIIEQQLINTGDLIAYAEEQGTELATLFSPQLSTEVRQFETQRAISWDSYWQTFQSTVVNNYFIALNQAWTNRQLHKVRHLVSDRLYEANSFWLDLYKKQHWQNRLDELTIQNIQLVKIEMDKYYEAITVRVFASCFDYTVNSENKIIAGSDKKRRAYTEYWTFARRAGIEETVHPIELNRCPQCGASADKMGQAAICEYCGAKISTGQFSWVVFLITQDENYAG